jgi:hypothetical protein
MRDMRETKRVYRRVGELDLECGGAAGHFVGERRIPSQFPARLYWLRFVSVMTAPAGSALARCDEDHVVRVRDVPRKDWAPPMFT